jgi:ATP-dependent protease Clp ATPase subunit
MGKILELPEVEAFCLICGRKKSEVEHLIGDAPQGAVCDICIDRCTHVLGKLREMKEIK